MSKYILLLIALAVVLIYLFFPRGDNAGQIEAVFNEIRDAAGNKDTEGVTEHFSLQYKDEYGAGYPAVKGIIRNAFQEYDGIQASYSGLSAVFGENEYGEKEAAANVDILVTGFKSGISYILIGSEGSPDNITVTLKKSGISGWKIAGVEGLDTPDDY